MEVRKVSRHGCPVLGWWNYHQSMEEECQMEEVVECRLGGRGRARGGFVGEAMLELNLKVEEKSAKREGIGVEDTTCVKSWGRGRMSCIYGTSGSH